MRGFTLIETVAVLVLVAILAFAVSPRFTGSGPFAARGFYEDALAMVQYARLTAVAKRRTVCVSVGAGSITLTLHSTAGATAACDNATPLVGPSGESPFSRTAPSGVTLTPASFRFDALGRPSFASMLTLQVVGAETYNIYIDPETGYARGDN